MATIIPSAAEPNLMTLIDSSGTTTYIGLAKLGASETDFAWQIQKISKTGTVTSIQFADGNTRFDNQWSDRTNLTYTN